MIYTVDTALHSLHTVRPGSQLEQKIQAANAKQVIIKGHIHKVCQTQALTVKTMLMLHGSQT